MSEPQRGGTGRFIAELRRRHVFRATVTYAAVVFVVLQAAEIIMPAFGFPVWGLRLIVVFAALGLPVVAVLAWVYEITPQGVRTMASVDAESGAGPRDEGSLAPRLALLMVTLVAVGASGWWWLSMDVPPASAAGDGPPASQFVAASGDVGDVPIRSLAVLPLEAFSSEDDEEVFAAGMQEALISRLSQLGTVRVVSRTSVNSYQRAGKSVTQVGRDLGVQGVVEGSVLRDGDRIRITVQLIHAPSDSHLWSRDYEEELTDIITLQREVADAIAAEIRGTLETPSPADERVAESPAARPEAAVANLRGRAALSEGSPAGVAEAERHFRQALSEDSTYSPAVVGLVNAQLIRGMSQGRVPEDVLASAERRLERVLENDPGSPEAREMLALIQAAHGLESVASLKGLDSLGVGIRVPDIPAMPFVSTTEMATHLQATMATRSASRATAPARVEAARSLVAIGRTGDAARLLEQVVQENPGHVDAWDDLERLHVMDGDLPAAISVRRRREAAVPSPEGAPRSATLATAVEREGAAGYWRWRLEELRARGSAGESVSSAELAAAYAGVGQGERALDQLEAALASRDPRVGTVRVDPVWDAYRNHPRFQRVVRSALHGQGRSGGPSPR